MKTKLFLALAVAVRVIRGQIGEHLQGLYHNVPSGLIIKSVPTVV